MTELSERNREIANLYNSGFTLKDVGDRYGISSERVRQIVAKFPTPDTIRRGAAMVEWRCPRCGGVRTVKMGQADRMLDHGRVCLACYRRSTQQHAAKRAQRFIAQRRAGETWSAIGVAAEIGYASAAIDVQRCVLTYLMRQGDQATISELWPKGVASSHYKSVIRKSRQLSGMREIAEEVEVP